MDIALVPEGSGVDGWDMEPYSDFVDVVPGIGDGVPCFDVVEGHDEVTESFEEGYGEFSDIFMMRLNIEIGVNSPDGLLSNQSLRLPLMLGLEQKLPIQVRNLL